MDRRLITIFAIDMVRSSRMMALDEAGTIQSFRAVRGTIIEPELAERKGTVIKNTGDGVLAEFPSAVLAVEAAVAIQRGLAEFEGDAPPEARLRFRIGINIGDVVVDGVDFLGDGVNLAALLESLAPPGGIYISRAVFDQVRGKIDAPLTALGRIRAKGMPDAIETWRVETSGKSNQPRMMTSEQAERPSIAVLPFQNMSSDPDQEFLVDGLVQDVITELSRFDWLLVIARNSTFAYRDSPKDVREVARELGVRYVVEGSVRRAGDRLRVTAQVIEASSGATVWASRWDRVMDDLFEVQDALTTAIVTGVAPELRAHERTIARKKPTESLSAWELCQRGDPNHIRGGPKEYLEGREQLRLAIELDPNFALPYALKSRYHSYALMVARHKDREQSIARGLHLAETAIRLDERGDEGYVSLALMLPFAERFDRAYEAIERAITLNPNNPTHRHYRGWLKTAVCPDDLDGIVGDVNDAIRLSPTDHRFWQFHFLRGMARVMLGPDSGHDAALADFRRSMEGPLCDWMPFLFAGFVHAHRGEAEEATRLVRTAMTWHPELTVPLLMEAQLAPLRPRYAALLETLIPFGLPES